jgi:hypothetical protein
MDGLSLDSLSFPQPISSEPSPQSLTPSHFHQIGTHCLLVQRNIQEWQVFWNHNTAYYASQLQKIEKPYNTILQNKQIVLQIYEKCSSVNLTYSHLATEVAVVLGIQKYNSPHLNLVVHADPDSRRLHRISKNYIYSAHSYTEEQKHISFYNRIWLLAHLSQWNINFTVTKSIFKDITLNLMFHCAFWFTEFDIHQLMHFCIQ